MHCWETTSAQKHKGNAAWKGTTLNLDLHLHAEHRTFAVVTVQWSSVTLLYINAIIAEINTPTYWVMLAGFTALTEPGLLTT